jgi:OPA family sugar phosphate sensor protein UhpC-like MFS transporter
MGVIGVFSYLGAAIQEQVSGILIDQNMTTVGEDKVYDFGPVIWFWIGSSVLSMLLAASLWSTKLRD